MGSSSLTASLLLLSLAFMQFVSAADQNNAAIKAEPGDNVILPCKDPDQGKITIAEWKRTDLGSSENVLLYKDEKIDPGNQLPSYRDRVDLLINQIRKGDVSLILKNTATDDSGTYECRVDTEKHVGELISTVNLVVAPRPPEPFPVWATVLLGLLGLLVLALAAAAVGVSVYFWFRWKPVPEQKEEESGKKFVLLPFKVPRCLWFCKYRRSVAKVEWKDGDKRKVHVYQIGSDQPGEQDEIYRTRTKMNLLKNGDLSLTLRRPTDGDGGTYTCSVSNRKGDVLMEKQVWLRVKVQQVEMESGVESVLLPCRTTEDLDGDVRVEWMDSRYRKVHMYQNGSDQPGEQDWFYRTRTSMAKNLLKTKDLSLTLSCPTYEDRGIFTCSVSNRDRDVLMVKQVQLEVKVPQVKVKAGEESVELPCRTTEDLDEDVRVEWMDSRYRTVHMYQNGSDQPGDQHQRYRTRTKMDENLQETKDLSLTLRRPTGGDGGIYTCRVSNSSRIILMEKQVQLRVKVKEQVEVEPGVESVLLPCRTTEDLDGDVRVEWRDRDNRKVHVYQNGSDQPGEQDQFYRTRTRMDENLLKTKDLSLTLRRPTDGDGGIYTCRVSNRAGVILMKQIDLKVKAGTVQVQPEDIMEPLLADELV